MTAAKRRAIDLLRRDKRLDRKHEELGHALTELEQAVMVLMLFANRHDFERALERGQPNVAPWQVHQSYLRDYRAMRMHGLADEAMEFSNRPPAPPIGVAGARAHLPGKVVA